MLMATGDIQIISMTLAEYSHHTFMHNSRRSHSPTPQLQFVNEILSSLVHYSPSTIMDQIGSASFDVPDLVSSEGGKCITDAVDMRLWGAKAIADNVDEYSGIETMAGSLPMIL
jgi:hypothetical protein